MVHVAKSNEMKTMSELYKKLHEGTEKLDELSNDTLEKYKTKAKSSADDLTAKGKHREATDRWGNVMKATGKQIDNTTAAIKKALRKEEAGEDETEQKKSMLQTQLHFIKYACEEILEYVEKGGEVEEWYQVKVAKSYSEFESLHSYMEGESRRTGMKEETELEEGMSPARQGIVAAGGGTPAEKGSFAASQEKPPFDGPYKKVAGTTTDKSGAKHTSYSKVRDLARKAMQKQMQQKAVKESLDESRKAEIVKEIVKKKKAEQDKFVSDPVLSSEIMKEDK